MLSEHPTGTYSCGEPGRSIQIPQPEPRLRSAVKDLPYAPCYIVLCLDAEDVDKWYARLETGFAAGNMLLQGSAMGVGCWFTTELGGDVQVGIREMIGADVDDVPVVVGVAGYVFRDDTS